MISEFYRKKYLTEQPFHAFATACRELLIKGVMTREDMLAMIDIAKENAEYWKARDDEEKG